MADKTSYLLSHKLSSTLHLLCEKRCLPSLGYIHGFSLASSCYLVSCSALADGEKPGLLYDTVAQSLPTGITIIGVYIITDNFSDSTVVERKFRNQISALYKVLPDDTTSILLSVDVNNSRDGFKLYEYDNEYYSLKSLSCNRTDYDILSHCIVARLQANLPLTMEYTDNKEKLRNDLFAEIEKWKEQLLCHSTAFHVMDSDMLLFTGDDNKTDYTFNDVIDHIHREDDEDDGFSKKSKRKLTDYSKVVIHLRLLCQRSDGETSQSSVAYTPVIHHKHGSFTHTEINLPIDIVAYVHPDVLATHLTYDMTTSICTQLDAFHEMITSDKDNALHTSVPFHFKPASLGHVITVVYPGDKTEEQLEPRRRRLHHIYHLPTDMPQLRRLNAFSFPDERLPGGYIINPHLGLSSSGVSGGCISLVRGQYTYHHYMQDRMDDNGWGCAYRSLQTLVSWFRLQGYTDKPIPSHHEIQKILVDIGDKDGKFINSKMWIGSTEVSFVLDNLLGVTSKILFVSSGAELETKARDLAVHFDTQGTPVMIGGGVLAHTILGVHFNDVSGDVKFLILDPHYMGQDDLRIIQDKGWCGWKSPTFWDKNAYYNLCMPQRPLAI